MNPGIVPSGWLLFEAGWAGVLACLAWLNLSWYRRARQPLLLWSAIATGAAVVSIVTTLIGLFVGAAAPWDLLVAVRAVATGLLLGAFVLCLHSLVPLPAVRAAVTTILASRLAFLLVGLLPIGRWTLAEGETSPTYSPVSRALFAVTMVVVLAYVGLAMARLPRRARVELGLTAVLSASPVLVALGVFGGWQVEVVASLWMVPLALLVGAWSGRHVAELRGSLDSALADRDDARELSHRQARTDHRTGLPNARGAGELLEARLSSLEDGQAVAVRVLTVDLGQVRADEGDLAADAASYQIAHTLRRMTEHADVARLGESVFCVIVTCPSDQSASRLATQTEEGSEAFRRGTGLPPGTPLHTGIAVSAGGIDADELLQRARSAAAEAQEQQRRVAVYGADLQEVRSRRARLGRLLTGAVPNGEIEVHYQPVVDTRTGRRAKVEALARWRHHGRLHPPDEWIPLAERRGLMPVIGEEVLRIAARDQVRLGCPVAVNVSPGQLVAPDFVASVLRIVGDSCPRERIVLEITEDAIMADFAGALRVLQELRAAGFCIALDDFGTKYSSLSRVAQVPFDILKIDGSFIQRLETEQGRAMVTAIQALTHALGKVSVAEGVETPAQLTALRDIGCDLVQGFLTGRPEPIDAAERRAGPPSWVSPGAEAHDVGAPPGASVPF